MLVFATGTTRNAAMLALEAEYYGRLPKAQQPQVRELAEGKTPAHTAATQLAALAALPSPAAVVMLDEQGSLLTSREWSERLTQLSQQYPKGLAFLIGGADGLAATVKAKATLVWSLGRLTLPHQLVRVVLAEQLYRAHTLRVGHPYHRD
jgi:23S rRNA (pseudouridine1915-N3)-methyltransferase